MRFKDVVSVVLFFREIVTFRGTLKFEYGRISKIMENGVVHIIKLDEFLKDTHYLIAIPTDHYPEICKINGTPRGSFCHSTLGVSSINYVLKGGKRCQYE